MSQKVSILGAGESGVGAAILAQKQGYEVWVSDFGKVADRYKAELEQYGIPFEELGHSEEKVLDADLLIKSPGIPEKAPIVQKVREKGIPLISEIEFGSRFTDARLVAITGSNGKTTTATLTHAVLNHAGLDVGLAGNIGDSFARQVALNDRELFVLEVSSFQLDDIESFKPQIAVLTNITEDHLDRYEYKMEKYAAAKLRIVENQGPEDHFIYCMDDPISMKMIAERDLSSKSYGFCIGQQQHAAAWLEEDSNTIHIAMDLDTTFSYGNMALRGRHNAYNTMAAAVVSKIIDLRKEVVREAFSDFRNIEHRLEKVTYVRGIEFINDSKATNVNSTWYALESVEKPIVWIVGGVDKGNDYSILEPLVDRKVKSIVAIGSDVLKIHKAFGDKVEMIVNTSSMSEAVGMAYHLADKGDAVLLSPACASFDLFDNYEDRGRQFKKAVKNL